MATLVEARVGRGELDNNTNDNNDKDNNTNDNDRVMGMMGGTTSSGLFSATTTGEDTPGQHLYSSTTSFTNAKPKGNVNFV